MKITVREYTPPPAPVPPSTFTLKLEDLDRSDMECLRDIFGNIVNSAGPELVSSNLYRILVDQFPGFSGDEGLTYHVTGQLVITKTEEE
jgi:hypothetical protein